jgi:putative FmdB family regulatory protein
MAYRDCDNRLAVPIYEYKCSNGHVFEAVQSMSDDPLKKCEQCGAPVERVFHPVAVHFKGSGFYTTDYGSGAKASEDGAGKDSEKSSKPAEKKKDSKEKDSKEKATSASSED